MNINFFLNGGRIKQKQEKNKKNIVTIHSHIDK